MTTILALFVLLIVIGVVFWGARKLLAAFQVGEPISSVVIVLLVLVCLVVVLQAFGLMPGADLIRLR